MEKSYLGKSLGKITGARLRRSNYKHNPLLIHSLVRFNFRPPLLLVFPGENPDRNRLSRLQVSTW